MWKTPTVLATLNSEEALRDFCRSKGINEVYVSIPSREFKVLENRLPKLINLLHEANISIEALLDSIDADKPGKPREAMLDHVKSILQFNQRHPADRFDGIHLDIEPHQRAENKGAGNLKCLPDLVATLRAVRSLAEESGMMTNADIPNKFLKGDISERRMLLTSVQRVTLMLYELNSPTDGKSTTDMIEKLRKISDNYFEMAYAGLSEPNLAKMSIALRTPDYLELLPEMLKTLDRNHQTDPHYLGWSQHSYNDYLPAR